MIALRKSTLWPRGIREMPFFHDLQQHVVRFGVGLLDLVKDHDRVRAAADGLGQLAGFFIADVSGRRAYQAADRVAFHELGHIQLDQGFFAAKQEACQRLGQLGLANAGWAEEDERTDRAARVFQPGARAAHGLGDGLDGFFLPDDLFAQFIFHVQQALRFFLRHLHHRHAGPHRNHLGDIIGGHDRAVGAVPAGAQLFELALQLSLAAAKAPGHHRSACLPPPGDGSGGSRAVGASVLWLVLAAGLLYMRTREEASSIRSMALSGRKRSVT